MRFDFGGIEDVEDFLTVPPGRHLCRVAEVREGRSREGSVRWSFRLEVLNGQHAGRMAAWDALTWGERGIYRVKTVLQVLGFDVSGVTELEPSDLVGRRALVTTELEERQDGATGRLMRRAVVPYSGYEPAPQEAVSLSAEASDWIAAHKALDLARAEREAKAAQQQHHADLARARQLREEADALDAKWRTP